METIASRLARALIEDDYALRYANAPRNAHALRNAYASGYAYADAPTNECGSKQPLADSNDATRANKNDANATTNAHDADQW